jgi:hypothetical protein
VFFDKGRRVTLATADRELEGLLPRTRRGIGRSRLLLAEQPRVRLVKIGKNPECRSAREIGECLVLPEECENNAARLGHRGCSGRLGIGESDPHLGDVAELLMIEVPWEGPSEVPQIPLRGSLTMAIHESFHGLLRENYADKRMDDKATLGDSTGVYRHTPQYVGGARLHASVRRWPRGDIVPRWPSPAIASIPDPDASRASCAAHRQGGIVSPCAQWHGSC